VFFLLNFYFDVVFSTTHCLTCDCSIAVSSLLPAACRSVVYSDTSSSQLPLIIFKLLIFQTVICAQMMSVGCERHLIIIIIIIKKLCTKYKDQETVN